MKKTIAMINLMILGLGMLFAKDITISVGAGENWKQKREPQVAIWLEDTDGNYIKTLYVTERASHKSWMMSPKEGRPESLPVWYHASKFEPAKNAAPGLELDAVTSATPKGGIIFDAKLEDKAYVLRAEFNTSFDYNDSYTKKNSGVNGQPSVVYEAEIPADFNKASEEIRLTFAGTGSLDGSDGLIHKDTAGLTTAGTIVKLVAVVGK